jgi:histone acetyltransferase (RNA polymerase elongator complex component)
LRLTHQFCHRERLKGAWRSRMNNAQPEIASLRFTSLAMTKLGSSALIRELHVYGELMPVGKNKKIQHTGLGKRLMAEAERIAVKNGYEKMAVIAGVGVRDYYRKMGYRLENTYMVKKIK